MKYQIKNIIEKGSKYEHLIEVRMFDNVDVKITSEGDAQIFFEEQKKEGYQFLKAYTEIDGKKYTLFCKQDDFVKLLTY